MKKAIVIGIISVVVILSVVVLIVVGIKGTPEIKEPDTKFSIGDSYSLTIVDRRTKKTMSNNEFYWSSDNFDVATVSNTGIIKINGRGCCKITAVWKEDISVTADVNIFCPYSTEPVKDEKLVFYSLEENMDFELDVLASYFEQNGKYIAKSIIKKKIGILGLVDLIISGLKRDVYWYSESSVHCKGEDAIIYTISDWTNESVGFSITDINETLLYEALKNKCGYGSQGDSFKLLLNEIKAAIANELPSNNIYALDKMDDDNEYRIVIRGDYSAGVIDHCYSNGLLIGMIDEIGKILNGDFNNLDSFMYRVSVNEVLDAQNIRICIERREKK